MPVEVKGGRGRGLCLSPYVCCVVIIAYPSVFGAPVFTRCVRFSFALSRAGGCCDCGDPSSWNSAGFCSAHKGPTSFRNPDLDPATLLPEPTRGKCRLV